MTIPITGNLKETQRFLTPTPEGAAERPGTAGKPEGWIEEKLMLYFLRLCYSLWLFYLHSAVKIQPFYPVFPLAGSTAKAFFQLSLWNFKEKSINHFL